MTKLDFIATIAPIAIKLKNEGSSIFPSVRIAQAMVETGSVIHPWNNLVGFKATSHTSPYWDGRTVGTSTQEEYNGVKHPEFANWRVYNSIEDCFRDQDLLFNWDNYDNIRNAKTPEQQCNEFMCSPEKYATDSHYAELLLEYLNDFNLKQYDVEEDDLKMNIADWAWTELDTYVGDAYNDKTITDWSWVQKVRDKTLTTTEAVLLKILIDARRQAKK